MRHVTKLRASPKTLEVRNVMMEDNFVSFAFSPQLIFRSPWPYAARGECQGGKMRGQCN